MSGALHARLLREKRSWLRDCRQRIEKELAEEQELAEGQRAEEDAVAPIQERSFPPVLETDGQSAATPTDAALTRGEVGSHTEAS
jgi:hypothetical protein